MPVQSVEDVIREAKFFGLSNEDIEILTKVNDRNSFIFSTEQMHSLLIAIRIYGGKSDEVKFLTMLTADGRPIWAPMAMDTLTACFRISFPMDMAALLIPSDGEPAFVFSDEIHGLAYLLYKRDSVDLVKDTIGLITLKKPSGNPVYNHDYRLAIIESIVKPEISFQDIINYAATDEDGKPLRRVGRFKKCIEEQVRRSHDISRTPEI